MAASPSNPAPTRRPMLSFAVGGAIGLVGLGLWGLIALGGPRPVPAEVAGHPVDVDVGQQIYTQTCATCHGRDGQGMPQQGTELVHSRFVADTGDAQLLRFLQVGRAADDPRSVMRRLMPPRGGNAALNDDDLASVVGYLRQMQASPPPANAGGSAAAAVNVASRQ